MSGPLVLGAENVILVPDKSAYAASRPIVEGLELITQLRHFPTSRTTVLVGIENLEPAEWFCKLNGLDGVNVVGVAPEDRDIDPGLAQWYALERQRASGPVNLMITAYPQVYNQCTLSHQPVLLFGRRGGLAAVDFKITPWSEFHGQVIKHRLAAVERTETDYS